MAKKVRPVTIKVHPLWFDGWFEPTRRKYERKFGSPISQVKFTELISNEFKLKPRRHNLIPKEFRNMKFYV